MDDEMKTFRFVIAFAIGAGICTACGGTVPTPAAVTGNSGKPAAVDTRTRDKGIVRAQSVPEASDFGEHDVTVSKLLPSGATEWEVRFGGDEDDRIDFAWETRDGGYVLAGFTESSGAGLQDLWVVKLRADGTIEWQKTFGGPGDDRAEFVRQTADLGYIIGGSLNSHSAAGDGFWLLKLKPCGRVAWQTEFAQHGFACSPRMIETEDGAILTGDPYVDGKGQCRPWDFSGVVRSRGTGMRFVSDSGGRALDPFHRLPFRKAILPAQTTAFDRRGETQSAVRGRGRLLILFACLGLMWFALTADLGPGRMQAASAAFGSFSAWFRWPTIASFAIFAVSTLWRLVLWTFYRPAPPLRPDDPRLPRVTVVVPAYNEGKTVGDCIRSIVASDYPPGRLSVTAVDDGSRDDTLSHMRAAAATAPDRVTVVRLPQNRGKRQAMYAGLSRTTDAVAVTVDSDTVVPPDAIRALVTPLVLDSRAGAVAGRIEVLNRDAGLITRMLGVRYRIGFDFQRAYQSLLGSVFVCPGALSAYRMDAIRDGLSAWLGQRFLGADCPTGDDHALTNVVLAGCWRTAYQSNAVAETIAPATYKGLSRMYLRWARSNIRESILYFGFAHRILREGVHRAAGVADAAVNLSQIPLRVYLLIAAYFLMALHPSLILKSLGVAIAVSLLQAAIYLKSEKSLDAAYAVLYAIFAFFTLQWIYPWAALTVRRSKWLTR
jgi:hyaluronan synthase